ncbi:MAG: hypothetical protein KC425_16105 [Anaerolineales bacterium]|nr:hypothetical protein [Anaerolineales bacterium]
MSEEKWGHGTRQRRNPSLFGPIVLIAIGVYFLLQNTGNLPDAAWNWTAVLQLWPLWLIFLGLNVLVRQVPRPFGAFLSALVGLSAVAAFGYVLLAGEDNALLARFNISGTPAEMQVEEISFAADDVREATVEIDFGAQPAELFALEDSADLIAGRVSYLGDLAFDTERDGGTASVQLNTTDGAGWVWFLNPQNWESLGDGAEWEVGLNPRVPLALRLDVGAGAVDLDLADLTLTSFDLDGGAGSVSLQLPDGDYGVTYEASAGSSRVWLGAAGRQTVEIDGSAGSVTLFLPPEMAARVEVRDGAGSFSLDRERFTQVSGSEPDNGVWETADYDDAPNRVDLTIDVGAGSVRIIEP